MNRDLEAALQRQGNLQLQTASGWGENKMLFHTRRISSYILGRLAPALSVPHSVTYVLPVLSSSRPPFYVPIPSPPPPNSSVTAYFVVLFVVRFLSIRHPARVPTFLAHVPRLSEHQTNPSPTIHRTCCPITAYSK